MTKFYVDLDVRLKTEAVIEADNLKEAIRKARSEDFEFPNLNDGIIEGLEVRYVLDENYNVLEEFV